MTGTNYNILPTQEFSKDFKKIDKHLQQRIKEKIEEVAQNPERYKHLHYDFKRSCRIRINHLRVIFSYNQERKELYLEKIVTKHHYT